jgi:hypothetical protein
MKRYLIAFDAKIITAAQLTKELSKLKITVAEVLEIINTIIVDASEKQIAKAKKQIKGIIGIDEEGEMHAL